MNRLTITVWLLTAALSACGQQKASRSLVAAMPKPEPEKVYTYVEQMPQLPGGGGQQAIGNEIMKRLRPFGKIEPSCYRVNVYFEVDSTGAVQHARILHTSESSVIDSAALKAVRSLPKLRPGYQQGRPVTVSLTMPFTVAIK